MKKQHLKIFILAFITGHLFSCDTVKRVNESELLLTQNEVFVNEKKDNSDKTENLLYQQPNSKFFGLPLRLNIYNTARPNRDSIFEAWLDKNPKRRERLKRKYSQKQVNNLKKSAIGFNNWLKETGEAPVIINESKAKKSVNRLEAYYINNGWFNAEANYNIIEEKDKKAAIKYEVKTGAAFLIDTITETIKSPEVKSIYDRYKAESFIKSSEQYQTANFEDERKRISTRLRNSGVYHFNQDYITFEIDTIGTNKKVNVGLTILNRSIRTHDSIRREPFDVYTIRDVNIITDYTFENRGKPFQDSTSFNGYKFYSYGKIKHQPKAIVDAVFIKPGDVFRDEDMINTYRHLKELQTFKYPNIEVTERLDNTITDTIKLTPLKKFSLGFSTDVSTSNIQTLGFSLNPSLLMRNIFRGAETLEIAGKGSIGSSKEANNNISSSDAFFDIIEYGIDFRLTIPRFFSPFYTKHLIPKYMSPTTNISLAMTSQTNIGLDKQTFGGIFNYNWAPNQTVTNRLEVFNVQYVQNLNVDAYFNVYQNSFESLNDIAQDVNYIGPDENLSIPDQANEFIEYATTIPPPSEFSDSQYNTVNSISERKNRLTENNLILSASWNVTVNERTSLFDEDYSIFRFKVEPAGNLLNLGANLLNLKQDDEGRNTLFDVAYSQFIKTEVEYIKHWDLGKKNILAFRSFLGVAIPYGNSNSIPFSRSFFAGGPNDNRAWIAYSLGPGSSQTTDEFNEANLKLAFNAEQRFHIFDKFFGAVFVDVGNIYNVLDNVTDEGATFTGFKSLEDLAVGSGVGLRYDFSFFVFRLDVGFKTHDPSYNKDNRWFQDFNFSNAVYNIGINYPF
ncbi:BamA/TamA family outer membrane protein [Tamlana sp. 2_MG-2023]|uniref:translocation and assembly module lipoprotein TamL n=1 Tax=unclassified Tamlana TaxID=2614803 RepID=UPI0026E281F3|nr:MULTISPECIES: BamA/TamA family outer membrane protein [unclassified Tamlana]MDO6758616.1 BamA/TamA family outer membrane protein [Tamlana sp. 2_MG-2023]MDO6789315.1 BamA/TamA family outer membrane protein [Tamlana sp. 1_MG-2023]